MMVEFDFDGAKITTGEQGNWLHLRIPFPSRVTVRNFIDTFNTAKEGTRFCAAIKEKKEKRTLDQNAYMWVLIGQLAAKISMPGAVVSPAEVYRELIRDVGGNYYVGCFKADQAEAVKKDWESHGVGWVVDSIGESKVPGCVNLRLFYGSSHYDTATMSRLIDVVIRECETQGIQTETKEEILKRGFESVRTESES